MRIDQDGNVAIGTSTASIDGKTGRHFTVAGDTTTFTSTILSTMDSQDNSARESSWDVYDSGNLAGNIITRIASRGNNDNSGNIHFYTSTSGDSLDEAMVLSSAKQLTVRGNILLNHLLTL